MNYKTIVFFFCLLAFVLVLFGAYQYNLGATPDSFHYIEFARNVAQGKGYINNLGEIPTHWPPGYSTFLGGISALFNSDVFEIGKYVNSSFAGLYVFIFNLILLKFTKSKELLLLLNIVLIFSPAFLFFSWFYAEVLFNVLLLLLFYVLLIWLQNNKIKHVIIAGIISGLLLVTRYAGLGMVGGICLFLLLYSDNSLRKGIKLVFLYTLPAIVINSVLIIYNNSMGATGADREIGFHPIPLRGILSTIKTILNWFLPFKQDILILGAAILCLALLIAVLAKYKITSKQLLPEHKSLKQFVLLSILAIATYILFLFVSISFIDAYTPMDNRILSPVFPIMLIVIIPFLDTIFSRELFTKWINTLSVIFAIVLITASSLEWSKIYAEGQGYTSKTWMNSEVLLALKKENNNIQFIYTNGHHPIIFYVPKMEHNLASLPRKIDGNKKVAADFENDFSRMKDSLFKKNTVLVYFYAIDWKTYQPSQNEILDKLKELPRHNFKDGFILGDY